MEDIALKCVDIATLERLWRLLGWLLYSLLCCSVNSENVGVLV